MYGFSERSLVTYWIEKLTLQQACSLFHGASAKLLSFVRRLLACYQIMSAMYGGICSVNRGLFPVSAGVVVLLVRPRVVEAACELCGRAIHVPWLIVDDDAVY